MADERAMALQRWAEELLAMPEALEAPPVRRFFVL